MQKESVVKSECERERLKETKIKDGCERER